MPATITSLLMILVGLAKPGGPGSPSRPDPTSIASLRSFAITDASHCDLTIDRSHRDETPVWTISEADTDEEQDDSCEKDLIGHDHGFSFALSRTSRKVWSPRVDRSIARLAPRSPLLRC